MGGAAELEKDAATCPDSFELLMLLDLLFPCFISIPAAAVNEDKAGSLGFGEIPRNFGVGGFDPPLFIGIDDDDEEEEEEGSEDLAVVKDDMTDNAGRVGLYCMICLSIVARDAGLCFGASAKKVDGVDGVEFEELLEPGGPRCCMTG